jgi:DNA-binding GntR family transcriptional regulator
VTGIEYIKNDNTSLRAKVFSRIQNDILNGVYQPGDSLTEKKLCEELGVSRTPVREALRQLELEELVQSTPNKGVIVTGVTQKDVEEIYIIRIMIEGLAARWATEHITPRDIQELKDALDLEEFYTMKKEAEHILKLDSKFHDILFRASKSKPLMHMLRTFHRYIQRARNASFESPDRAKKVLEEHKAILDAVIEGDADRAERVTKEHVKNASIAYKKLIKDKV